VHETEAAVGEVVAITGASQGIGRAIAALALLARRV